jgi:hypothetical protein
MSDRETGKNREAAETAELGKDAKTVIGYLKKACDRESDLRTRHLDIDLAHLHLLMATKKLSRKEVREKYPYTPEYFYSVDTDNPSRTDIEAIIAELGNFRASEQEFFAEALKNIMNLCTEALEKSAALTKEIISKIQEAAEATYSANRDLHLIAAKEIFSDNRKIFSHKELQTILVALENIQPPLEKHGEETRKFFRAAVEKDWMELGGLGKTTQIMLSDIQSALDQPSESSRISRLASVYKVLNSNLTVGDSISQVDLKLMLIELKKLASKIESRESEEELMIFSRIQLLITTALENPKAETQE